MTLIYTHENIINVTNIKNILSNSRIETELRNQFASGAAGDLAPFETWPQLWLKNEDDHLKAQALIDEATTKQTAADWICNHCQEQNAATFDFCWNCQEESD